ncbi:uncharacterized protein [Macrobrachium rosenbergii]
MTKSERCQAVTGMKPIFVNCQDNTEQTKDPSQCQLKPKANSRVIRDILVTLLVVSLLLNSSLATYIFFLRRHYKQSTFLGQESAASAVPPVTHHGSDHLYQEIPNLHIYESPPPLPPALRAAPSYASINSVYQKFSDEKEEAKDEGPPSGSASKHRDDHYVELSHGYAEPADVQPLGKKEDSAPLVRSSGDKPKEPSHTESDNRFSNETETCSVRTHSHKLSDAPECHDDVINSEA